MKQTIIFLIFILSASLPQRAFAEKQLVDRIVAVVNDDAITQSELDMLLRPLFAELKKEFHGEELYKRLGEYRLKLLNQLIEDRLVFQEAVAMGVEANDGEIEAKLREFKERFPGDEEMEEALRQQGVSLGDIRERLRRQAIIRRVHDSEIRSKVVVSPLQIQDYYTNHPEDFTEKTKLKVRSMTIKKSEEAREKGTKDEKAWQVVHDLRKQVENGEDFAALAKKYSEDVHAPDGGMGDWIEKGEMIEVIDETLFQLKQGETSRVIETSMGYHFFFIEERKEGSKRSLDEVRDQIFGYLFQQKSEERFQEWMETLKGRAYISIR